MELAGHQKLKYRVIIHKYKNNICLPFIIFTYVVSKYNIKRQCRECIKHIRSVPLVNRIKFDTSRHRQVTLLRIPFGMVVT